jgi:hypothetical protein
MKHWPFTVLNKGGKPVIEVEYKGEKKEFVSTMIPQSRTQLLIPLSSDTRRDLVNDPRQDAGDGRSLPR